MPTCYKSLLCRALPGLNSAAVGLIVASVFQLALNAYGSSPFPTTSVSIGIIGFAATETLKVPAPFVVIGGGVLGACATPWCL
jgi:chromate transporter